MDSGRSNACLPKLLNICIISQPFSENQHLTLKSNKYFLFRTYLSKLSDTLCDVSIETSVTSVELLGSSGAARTVPLRWKPVNKPCVR